MARRVSILTQDWPEDHPPAQHIAFDLETLHEAGRTDAVVPQNGQRVALRQGVQMECVKLEVVRSRQKHVELGYLHRHVVGQWVLLEGVGHYFE